MQRRFEALAWLAIGFGVAMPASAQAPCPMGTRLNQTQLDSTFTGRTLCMTRGSERWQEEHRSGGLLWDYKRGDGHAVDPRKQVGTWSISGTGASAMLTHTYPSAAYSWAVCGPGGPGTGYTLIGSGGTLSGGTVQDSPNCGF